MTSERKKKKHFKINWTETIIIGLIVLVCGVGVYFVVKNINMEQADYIVETNAFFPPFEFYDGTKIKGIDADIISKVADKLGKKIVIKDVEFDVIIDNVAAGKIADAGAAGLTITEARKEKVDFSIPYYTSVQYVVYDKNKVNMGDYITWKEMAGKKLGSQMGGTGYLFAQDEVENGELIGANVELKGFESHQLAADAIKSGMIDFAIVDELVAKNMVLKNEEFATVPVYHAGKDGGEDKPTMESYAIAVNKNRPELLEAFNEVLEEMMQKDENGESEIDRLIINYMGI